MNKKVYWVFAPVLLLFFLGALNIYKKVVWKEPTDGVVWKERQGKVTAVRVEAGSPAYLAGIEKGDILYFIEYGGNRVSVRTRLDVVKHLWAAAGKNQSVIYQISKEGELANPVFYLGQKKSNLIYFYLALTGITTLIIGLVVFLNSKRALTIPYLYFYMLSLVLFGFYTFSPTGELDFLDSLFFWIDKTSFLLFPPLLLHFFLIFPQRKRFIKKTPSAVFFLYGPGILLLLAKVVFHLPLLRTIPDARILAVHEAMEKMDLGHFALFTCITLVTIIRSVFRTSSILIKKQLKLIAYGLGFGIVPFTFFYSIPFLLGLIPSRLGELTALLQALVPLTFAYSISRYKLMDFEVLLKKAATLVFSYFVIACFYIVVSSQTRVFSENKLNILILGILAMILGATLFSPLKRTFQSLLDRVFYKRSYVFRKTLRLISRELSRERNLHRLTQSLLDLVVNAISLRSIALLLPAENDPRLFQIAGSRGELSSLPETMALDPPFQDELVKNDFLSYFDIADKKELLRKWEPHTTLGIFHFLPLRVEDKMIGCLAMGKKHDGTYLTSEDWELLTTISSPVALALENAYLYNQAGIRARELERLKDYSENIIESLTVGVAVLNQKGEIIGWNRVLEDLFAVGKQAVIGRSLFDVLGDKNFKALYPPDTQQSYRLLSEIRMELPQGEEKIFDIAKTPLRDNRLTPYGTIIVFEDITEKIQLQQQLVTSEKLASIGLLSAGVAHEINTPLTGISSYIQILQKKLTDSFYQSILEKIESQTDRVARIIKNLLNFARNPSEISFYRVSLKDILQEIISLIDYKLKAMNIRLEMNLAPVKPIWAQGERLQQVFINIILNAIDAMPHGGTLRIDLVQGQNAILVKITDTGTGIKKHHLSHIFDPFFTTKGVGKGTGLGLSISYAIIKEHEGHIGVASDWGKGTSFTISLPPDLEQRKMNHKHPVPQN